MSCSVATGGNPLHESRGTRRHRGPIPGGGAGILARPPANRGRCFPQELAAGDAEMAARTVRPRRRRSECASTAARMVRTDAPRRTGPILPRPGLGHAQGSSGEADRPRPVPAQRLSRHGAGLHERPPDRLDVPASLRGRWGFQTLQRHRALLALSSACPCGGPEAPGALDRENCPLERGPGRRSAARAAQD